MTRHRLAAGITALTLLLAACGGDDADSTGGDTAATTAPSSDSDTFDPDCAWANGTRTVTEVLADPCAPDPFDASVMRRLDPGFLGTLAAAVDAADLGATLDDGGPFTVFAPSSPAFAAFLAEQGVTAEELLSDVDVLTAVLTYHVVPEKRTALSLVNDPGDLDTVQGEPLTTVFGDYGLKLLSCGTEVGVVQQGIEATNAIIHVIDGVLLPPTAC